MLSDRKTWLSPQDWNIEQPLLQWCWSLHPRTNESFISSNAFVHMCVSSSIRSVACLHSVKKTSGWPGRVNERLQFVSADAAPQPHRGANVASLSLRAVFTTPCCVRSDVVLITKITSVCWFCVPSASTHLYLTCRVQCYQNNSAK